MKTQSNHASSAPSSFPRIGVFDSGVGGLSVLRAIQAALPTAPLTYFADSGHAPYGDKTDAFLLDRSHHIAAHLIGQGCGALVIACNTATAVAANALRQAWPAIPIVAVEPGVKPAVLASKNRRVGVLGTGITLASPRFQRLLEEHGQGAHVITQPCAGLALAIESGDLRSAAIHELVQRYCEPLRQAGVDTVVLGCTHYAFIRDSIEAAMGPDVKVMDTAEAVARQTVRVLEKVRRPHPAALPIASALDGALVLQSSGDAAPLNKLALKLAIIHAREAG